MNCLSTEQLVTLTLGEPQTDRPDERAAAWDHVRDCPRCGSALARVEEDLGRIAAAHAPFEQGHAAGRDRLLAALPTRTVKAGRAVRTPTNRFRRMWIGGAAALAV